MKTAQFKRNISRAIVYALISIYVPFLFCGCASEEDSRLLVGTLVGGAYPGNAGAQFVGSALVANANSRSQGVANAQTNSSYETLPSPRKMLSFEELAEALNLTIVQKEKVFTLLQKSHKEQITVRADSNLDSGQKQLIIQGIQRENAITMAKILTPKQYQTWATYRWGVRCEASVANPVEETTPKQGLVSIVCSEENCDIFTDDSFIGNAPAKLQLSEGMHVVEVKKTGFKDYKKEIKVMEGSELNLKAVLEKE
jgi:hypothetical protein